MKITRKGTTTILQDNKKNFKTFLSNIGKDYDEYKSQNLVLDISLDDSICVADVINCKEIAKKHTQTNHSFVIVSAILDYDSLPQHIIVVPTLQEAFDIIEMEEIERDLGF